MKERLKTALLATLVWSFSAATSSATVLTFDDLPSPGPDAFGLWVPNGYGGLQWVNWYGMNIPVWVNDWHGGGAYAKAAVSGDWIAFDRTGKPAQISVLSGAFNLHSLYMTAVWNDDLEVTVRGFAGQKLVYDNLYTLHTSGPELFHLDFEGVTRVNFLPAGGTPNPAFALQGAGLMFAIDNLHITLVPEGGSSLLLLTLAALSLITLSRAWRNGRS